MSGPNQSEPSALRRLARKPYHGARHRIKRARVVARAAKRRGFVAEARRIHLGLTLPTTVLLMFLSADVHPAYRFGWRRRYALALRMYRNTRRVVTGSTYKAHLAMAVKLLEIPPEVEGDVVECGCFLGGSTANLSLICEIVDRRLIAYDSFEGLPAPTEGDKYATERTEGAFRGDLEIVRDNVRALGAIDRVEFRKGWFEDTLPGHDTPVVLCFLDVDYQASLRDCVLNLWPHLTERGYVFIDEYVLLDYCALFFSERFWSESFGTTPPGLIGAGSGVGVGELYLGPAEEQRFRGPGSVAYTRKDLSGHWDYFPSDEGLKDRVTEKTVKTTEAEGQKG
jgi:O-methyltransferase